MSTSHTPAPAGSPTPQATVPTSHALSPDGAGSPGGRSGADTPDGGPGAGRPGAGSPGGGPGSGLLSQEEGTLMQTLRMEVVERGAQRTVVRMPVDGARQVIGILHGGASAAVIETAASVAAREAAPEGHVAVGAELQVSHLRPATAGLVTATATPLHVGRRTCVYEVSVRDEQERAVAHGTLRSLFTPRR